MIKQQNLSLEIASQIIQKTKQQFRQIYFKKFKKQEILPSTVLSSFALYDISSNDYKLISIGFGTKSLPFQNVQKMKGYLIKDMHAQMLAKQGFRRFIIDNIPKQQENNQVFIWNTKRKKHQLKQKYKILFYSSEIFCGDCFVDIKNDTYSGARPLKYFKQKIPPVEKYEECCLRTKPGRLDLPLNKRSLSLSCSDKIALWTILGIQGKRLFKKVSPIYIDSIIVQNRIKNLDKNRIKMGINPIFRVKKLRSMQKSQKSIEKGLYRIINSNYLKAITYQFKHKQPQIIIIDKQQQYQNEKKKLDLCGIIYGQQAEWINGRTGVPQGVNINKLSPHKLNYFSKYCTKKIQQSLNLPQSIPFCEQEQIFKYCHVKNQIKSLFSQWTDDYKN